MQNRDGRNFIDDSSSPNAMSSHRKLMKVLSGVKLIVGFLFKQYSKFLAPLFVSLLLILWFFGSLICFVAVLFVCIGVFLDVQDLLLYHPDEPKNARQYVPIPTAFGLPFENVYIPTPDGCTLHAFLIKQSHGVCQNVPTVVFMHGNAGNIGQRLENCQRMFRECCVNILLVEYRGFGKSTGSISEEGLYKDAEAAVLYAAKRKDIDARRVVLFGRSLGGAVAVRAAGSPQCAHVLHAVILENTFTSIPDIARVVLGLDFLKYLPMALYKNKYLSEKAIRRLGGPVLFLSGQADELVPQRMMKQLHSACPSEHKQMVQFPRGTHNDTWTSDGYFSSIRQFLVYCETVKKKTCTISL